MLRLGGAASPAYISVFRGLQTHFRQKGLDLDWVLYSDYDALVNAFVNREIDLAWNGPLAYVKIRRRLSDPCQVVAMRDVDVNFTTHFIASPTSNINTLEDLKGKRVALGSRRSVQAGLLAYYFLQQAGLDPEKDLAACTFYDERQSRIASDERDVIERVSKGEYDAGAVCQRTLDVMQADGTLAPDSCRTIWSSPGYSHCCFSAHSDMDPALAEQITQAFVSVTAENPAGKAVLEGEACSALVAGTLDGWDALEKAAEQEGLL
ncbi:MAG: phosphate/phosphite/phosphonate ABC transporter substrate-binding protein [Candidatus Tectomicrobia bacterium]|nr:phosphate/phosphite/phosphonate ABC transporter substrate-binding protein [Candidatus Tectomicrobia bacterium]